ncbi:MULTISPECIES: ISKra4 family transposase [Paraburkholderia]|uniref:ISKra4 family transposase n=1 Tax=Paraburkholderia madseniana TaxID=2599607 RepID=A0A6N6W6Y5_9BURK|nr:MULTISPECIES: ISKra4 family transposase [Paraburkholderia]KAE8756193.1 ISKra4 family transposase [Paraburkholderia madseniana]MCX4172931.1 ISKra4 family transposase [Paraburkholderia madseniana]MDQ6460939.1 ISKra4 family transposase [Paraburkholderia madseniana]
MDMHWTIYLQRDGADENVPLARFQRPLEGATPADFGLSMSEARSLLSSLQQVVAQDQIRAYDARRRRCRHCGRYRRIKDWRPRVFATALGSVKVRVPRVISCLCTPEPLDENDDSADLRFSECPIESLLPGRRTPELAYLCAKRGAAVSYRSAARNIADLTGLQTLSHATVRKETLNCGEQIENDQFYVGWFAGTQHRGGTKHLRLAIDGTVVTAVPLEEVRRIEVIAGRVECEGIAARRFARALQRPSLTRVLIAAALDQCDWVHSTLVDVVTDGARGMRSLVTSVAPCVAPRILDWFHIGMKLHAVRSALCAYTFPLYQRPVVMRRCERLINRVRDKLWRGRGDAAIEILRTLIASLNLEIGSLPQFYGLGAGTASSAAARLLTFLVNNRSDLIDYQQARMNGRRVSSASAESVMNHLINRRLTKRQQMRWSLKGAHYLLQTRIELLDGRLETCFAKRFPHFRSPEVARQ